MLASHDHVLRKLLGASCSVLSLLSLPGAGGAEPLPAFNVDIKETSVSGLSSGGFMAVQFQIAFSSIVKGAGIVAGGPYFCARGSQTTATGPCMKANGPINVPELVTITNSNAAAGLIDATANLANHKVWLFSGSLDSTVKQAVMNELNAYYLNFVGGSNVSYKKTIPAAHAMPTEVYGNVCSVNADPYINDCDFDAAGELLKWIYGSLNPRSTGPASGERFVEFDQSEFLPNPTSHGMANTGWLYVPSSCANGQACRLHVAFHGCRQYPSYQYFVLGQGMVTYGTTFVKNSGYNGWADTNNIIVLYPQTTSSFVPANPLGCWDWWGYDDAAYVTRNGRQMKAVKAMVDRITQGAVALAAPTGLRVTANGDSSLSLAWDAVAGAAGYAVYRGGTKIGGAAGETHVDNGLASGTEYRYVVSALAPSGAEGRPSSELLGKTTGGPPVVPPPTNLAAGAVTPNSVGLSWAAAAGAAGYDVFRGTGTGAPVKINPTRVPVTSYTAEGLTPSTTYSFTVKAYDTAGAASGPSNPVTIVTGAMAACFMASNFAHVQAGRAHDRGGIAFANGSDERMGLNNLFFITTLKQTGSNFYVVDNLTCP